MAAQAGASLAASYSGRQSVSFPKNRPFWALTLYELSAHLRELAAREGDYRKRRMLERRSRACQRAAREALRATLAHGGWQ